MTAEHDTLTLHFYKDHYNTDPMTGGVQEELGIAAFDSVDGHLVWADPAVQALDNPNGWRLDNVLVRFRPGRFAVAYGDAYTDGLPDVKGDALLAIGTDCRTDEQRYHDRFTFVPRTPHGYPHTMLGLQAESWAVDADRRAALDRFDTHPGDVTITPAPKPGDIVALRGSGTDRVELILDDADARTGHMHTPSTGQDSAVGLIDGFLKFGYWEEPRTHEPERTLPAPKPMVSPNPPSSAWELMRETPHDAEPMGHPAVHQGHFCRACGRDVRDPIHRGVISWDPQPPTG